MRSAPSSCAEPRERRAPSARARARTSRRRSRRRPSRCPSPPRPARPPHAAPAGAGGRRAGSPPSPSRARGTRRGSRRASPSSCGGSRRARGPPAPRTRGRPPWQEHSPAGCARLSICAGSARCEAHAMAISRSARSGRARASSRAWIGFALERKRQTSSGSPAAATTSPSRTATAWTRWRASTVPPRQTDTLSGSMARRLKTLWPSGGPVAAPGLPQAMGRPDDQPVREPDLRARAADRGHRRARRERLPGRAAGDGRVPAVPPLHAAGGRLGRPASPAPDPRHRRPRARRRARLGARRLRVRRAHDLAALRRRLRRRHADRVLRRRVPVLSTLARPPEPARGGQLEARAQRVGRAARGTGRGRRARRAAVGALGRADGRDQLPRLRALRAPDPHARGGRGADGGCGAPGHAGRGLGGHAVRVEGPAAACADREHGDLQLLRERRVRGLSRLRGSLARPLAGCDRHHLLAGERRLAGRRGRRGQGCPRSWASEGRSSSRALWPLRR